MHVDLSLSLILYLEWRLCKSTCSSVVCSVVRVHLMTYVICELNVNCTILVVIKPCIKHMVRRKSSNLHYTFIVHVVTFTKCVCFRIIICTSAFLYGATFHYVHVGACIFLLDFCVATYEICDRKKK